MPTYIRKIRRCVKINSGTDRNMPFIKFTESGRSFAPKATISTHGALSFNEGACSRFGIKTHEAVVLYYDPEEFLIGIELTQDKTVEGARPLRKRTMGADLAIKPFLDRWDIFPKGTTSYPLVMDEETGLLIVDVKRGTRRGKKADFNDE